MLGVEAGGGAEGGGSGVGSTTGGGAGWETDAVFPGCSVRPSVFSLIFESIAFPAPCHNTMTGHLFSAAARIPE